MSQKAGTMAHPDSPKGIDLEVRIMDKQAAIARLNDFVREEISTVKVYKQAISIMPNSGTRQLLEELQVAHSARISQLKERILELGGTCDTTDGLWFKLPVDPPAGARGETNERRRNIALTVLEEEENEGLRNYKSRLETLDTASKLLVLHELLPGQEVTRLAISQLKARMTA